MDIIEKLNQEFDEVQNKNIKLEKENLQLYKEIHKLKFKFCIREGDLDCPLDYYGQYFHDWSPELNDAVDHGLEKNIILREIWDYPDDQFWGLVGEIEILDGNFDWDGEERDLIDSFSGGVYH